MIQLSPKTKIYCAIEAVDFRKGIDGLAHTCQATLEKDPFSGQMFIFRNRGRTGIKMLFYDGQGFWLCLKRLSKGRFVWWAQARKIDERTRELMMSELQVLLWNGNPDKSGVSAVWRKLT